MPKQAGPDFILESNPDGPALTGKELKALTEHDQLQAHQDARSLVGEAKAGQREFAGMLEATDESLARIRSKLKELGLEKEHHRNLHGGQRRHVRIEPIPRGQSSEEVSGQPLCFLQPPLRGRKAGITRVGYEYL